MRKRDIEFNVEKTPPMWRKKPQENRSIISCVVQGTRGLFIYAKEIEIGSYPLTQQISP
jgi:hypothetical protein